MGEVRASLPEARRKTLVVVCAVIMLVAAGWALRATSVFMMPLAVSLFIAVLVRPLERWVRSKSPRGMRWLGVLAAMAAFVAVLALVGLLLFLSGRAVAAAAPKYGQQIQGYWQQLVAYAHRHGLELNTQMLTGEQSMSQATSLLTGGLMSIWSIVGAIVIVFFLLLLVLLEVDRWRDKIEKATSADAEYKILATIDTAAVKLRQYMLTATAISATSGAVEGAFLWLMGVDLALMWALLIFLANYVPNIGSIVSLGAATAMAFMQLGWQWGLAVGVGLTLVDQTIGNFIAPRIQGRRLSLSPLAMLVSILFWGWLWGVIGAVLATPIMLVILVACAHTQSMRWLATMLSERGNDEDFRCADSGSCP